MKSTEYEPNSRSLLVVSSKGLKWLQCPFTVKVLDSIKVKINKPLAEVQAIYSSEDGKLVYLVEGQLFYAHHFSLDV